MSKQKCMPEIGPNYNSRTNACCVGRCTFSSASLYVQDNAESSAFQCWHNQRCTTPQTSISKTWLNSSCFKIAHLAPYSATASMHKAKKKKKFHISTELLRVTSMNENQGLQLWLASYTVPNTILLVSAAAGSNWRSNAGRYTILLLTFAAFSLVYWQKAWMQQSFMQLKIKEIKGSKERYLLGQIKEIKGSKERYLLGQNTTCSVAFCCNKWCSVEQFMCLDLVLGC